MTVIIIILSVILVFAGLFTLPIVVKVSYIDSDFKYRITYAGIPLFPRKPSKRRKKPKSSAKKKKLQKAKKVKKNKSMTLKKTQQAENKKQAENISFSKQTEKNNDMKKSAVSDKKEKESDNASKNAKTLDGLKDKLEMIFEVARSSGKGVRRILKRMYFTDVKVNIVAADEDAYECAMKYGRVNSYLAFVLGLLSGYFSVRAKEIKVAFKYNSDESVYDFSFKLKLKLGTAIFSVLGIFITYMINNREEPRRKRKPVKGYTL